MIHLDHYTHVIERGATEEQAGSWGEIHREGEAVANFIAFTESHRPPCS
jgi:hypothetical protein